MTGCIQLALSEPAKANALQNVLARSTQAEVVCVDCPDLERACVVVVDAAHLNRLPVPLSNPDKVVLISRKDAGSLKDAWDAGINFVVSDQDPMNTVVLAILAACLRSSANRPKIEADSADPRQALR
jgi:hypothetical protein